MSTAPAWFRSSPSTGPNSATRCCALSPRTAITGTSSDDPGQQPAAQAAFSCYCRYGRGLVAAVGRLFCGTLVCPLARGNRTHLLAAIPALSFSLFLACADWVHEC